MLKFIIACALIVSMSGCSARNDSQIVQKEPVVETPYSKGCENDTHITNAEIISEVKVCTSAGLNASALHCRDNITTTHIQCEPKNE